MVRRRMCLSCLPVSFLLASAFHRVNITLGKEKGSNDLGVRNKAQDYDVGAGALCTQMERRGTSMDLL